MQTLVSYRRDDAVANITIDDGKLNVVSPQLLHELGQAFDRAQQDGAVVVLRGRPGVFSAGFDLSVLRGPDLAARVALLQGGFQLAERLLSFPLPVVAACSGHAIAMGVFLLLATDYRVGARGPFKISANEVAIGMTVPRAAIEICRQRLVPAHFVRAVTLAEPYANEAAVEAGFLDRLVDVEAFDEATGEVASAFAKLDLRAHAETKQRLRAQTMTALRVAMEHDDAEWRAAL